METRLKGKKKRFAPVAKRSSSSLSDIVIFSESEEEITQKQPAKPSEPQRPVHHTENVGHQWVASTPKHGRDNFVTNISSWPSPILNTLSKPRNEQRPNTRNNCSANNKREIEEQEGRQNVQEINTQTNKTTSVQADEEYRLMVRQRMPSSTSIKKSHAISGKKLAPVAKHSSSPLSDIAGILSESEEEIEQEEPARPSKPQRLVRHSENVGHRLVASTPLHGRGSFVTNISSWPSPILTTLSKPRNEQRPNSRNNCSANDKREIEEQEGRQNVQETNTQTNKTTSVQADEEDGLMVSQRMPSRTSQRKSHAITGKKVPLPLQDLYQIISDDEEVIEKKTNNDDKRHRRFPKNQLKDGEKNYNLAAENRNRLRSRTSHNSRRGSLSRLKTKTTAKKKDSNPNNKKNKMTMKEPFEENHMTVFADVHAEENAHDGKNVSTDKGVMDMVQDKVYNIFDTASCSNGVIFQKKKRDKINGEEKPLEPEVVSTDAKQSYISAGSEKRKMRTESVTEIDLRRSKRKRVKCLEYWRGERIQYERGTDGCREVVGIDPGLPSRVWKGPAKISAHSQKRELQLPLVQKQHFSRKLVVVPQGSGERELECFSTLRFESDMTEHPEQNNAVFTGIEVPGMTTGYIEIPPFTESYSVVDSNLVCYILIGTLIVTVHETTKDMKKGEFFFVPQDVHYSVKNSTRNKAVLVFTKYD